MEQNEEQTTSNIESKVLARERNRLASERTRLAAERTISAWIRTGLASVGGGFAIIRLVDFQNVTHRIIADGIGGILIILGILILLLALIDYTFTCKNLQQTINKRNEIWVIIITMVLALLSSSLLIVAYN